MVEFTLNESYLKKKKKKFFFLRAPCSKRTQRPRLARPRSDCTGRRGVLSSVTTHVRGQEKKALGSDLFFPPGF